MFLYDQWETRDYQIVPDKVDSPVERKSLNKFLLAKDLKHGRKEARKRINNELKHETNTVDIRDWMHKWLTSKMFPQRLKRFAVLLTYPTSWLMNRMIRGFHVLNKMLFLLILLIACQAFVSVGRNKLVFFKETKQINNYTQKRALISIYLNLLRTTEHFIPSFIIYSQFWQLYIADTH